MKLVMVVFGLLILGVNVANGQEKFEQGSGGLIVGKITGPEFLVISGKDGELVRISMKDGSITYGEGYKPDVAAKVFWDAVSRERNCR